MKYRAEIDGLRAIAIILVLIYHGGLSLFPSGFVGVDVFFVISGFLITSIVHDSLEKGQFSFTRFYSRRLWRLQPVFIALLVLTTAVTLLFYLPDDLIQFSRSARKASLFLSNNYFKQTTTGYFSPDITQLPLLHTWSLSIEWQCYLILPVALYLLHRVTNKNNFRPILYALTLIFFALSLHWSALFPAGAYYQLSSRIFEFLIGSCVAVGHFKFLFVNRLLSKLAVKEQTRGDTERRTAVYTSVHEDSSTVSTKQMPYTVEFGKKSNKSNALADRPYPYWHSVFMTGIYDVLGFSALISIFYIASRHNIMLGYPNGYTLILCLATGILLLLGQYNPTPILIRLLTIKPLVFIGWLSYSLYIWHWAVFSFIRYQGVAETGFILSMAYLLTFVLAYISWRFIEKPSRQFNQINFGYTIVSLLLLPIALMHGSAYLIKGHLGFPQRFNQELVTIYKQLNAYESTQRPGCITSRKSKVDPRHCTLGSKRATSKKGLMIGDSFSNHYWGFMDTLGKAANVSILAQGTSSCITLPGIYLYDWWHFKDQVYQVCHDQAEYYFNLIKANHYDYVILGQVWNNYFSEHVINHPGDQRSLTLTKKRLKSALEEALQVISLSGARPVLIKTSALMKNNYHDCFFSHIKLRKAYDPEQCSFDWVADDADRWFDSIFTKLHKKFPKLIVIDPKEVQCNNHRCRADINGIPVYRDVGHITDYASYQLGRLYLQRFKNPFKYQS